MLFILLLPFCHRMCTLCNFKGNDIWASSMKLKYWKCLLNLNVFKVNTNYQQTEYIPNICIKCLFAKYSFLVFGFKNFQHLCYWLCIFWAADYIYFVFSTLCQNTKLVCNFFGCRLLYLVMTKMSKLHLIPFIATSLTVYLYQ